MDGWGARTYHYQVSRKQAGRFYDILEPHRPLKSTKIEPICKHEVAPEEAPLLRKAREVELVWAGPSGTTHLIACFAGGPLDKAIDYALASVGLDGSAIRIPED